MKNKVHEATGTTIDDALYNAMVQRWNEENYKEAEVIDTKIETVMRSFEDGYKPVIHFRVWVGDA